MSRGSAAARSLGRSGEDLAAAHLTAAGLDVIDRNWRCRQGEIDIVARDGATLVVVEVKTRSSDLFGTPAEAVGAVKARRLRGLGARWVLEHRPSFVDMRFDVVSVLELPGRPPVVEHLVGAF